MRLDGKIAFITGASSGFGLAIAYEYAQAGAKLILTARRYERLVEIANKLKEDFNTEVYVAGLDVRNFDAVTEFYNNIPEEFKSIDILVNNAGLARGMETIDNGVLENWEEMIDTNVKGLLYVSRNVLPDMVKRNSGMVINISSIAGRDIYPKGNVYCASKAAARMISQSIAVDLNGTNIRSCNIDPGLAETEFSIVRFRGDEDKAKSVYNGLTPLYGKDIAEIALFVATRPEHVMIQDIVVTPTAQATPTIVSRKL